MTNLRAGALSRRTDGEGDIRNTHQTSLNLQKATEPKASVLLNREEIADSL